MPFITNGSKSGPRYIEQSEGLSILLFIRSMILAPSRGLFKAEERFREVLL
jgi:hypothetical protein